MTSAITTTLCMTLGGVECHNSSGAQHRAYCGTNDCVVKSVNLAATYPAQRMALQSAWNTSGYSTIISIVAGTVTGKYTQSLFADTACPPTGSDYAMEGTGTGLTSVLGVAQPWDFAYTSMDGSAYPITAWWEWNLTP